MPPPRATAVSQVVVKEPVVNFGSNASGKSISACRGLAELESTCQPCKPLFSCRLRTCKCDGFARAASDTAKQQVIVKQQVIQQSSK